MRVSAAGGTECAGVPSKIDVQARYENVSLTHTGENDSDFRSRQCPPEIVSHGELLQLSFVNVARTRSYRRAGETENGRRPGTRAQWNDHLISRAPMVVPLPVLPDCSSHRSHCPLVCRSERRDAVRRQHYALNQLDSWSSCGPWQSKTVRRAVRDGVRTDGWGDFPGRRRFHPRPPSPRLRRSAAARRAAARERSGRTAEIRRGRRWHRDRAQLPADRSGHQPHLVRPARIGQVAARRRALRRPRRQRRTGRLPLLREGRRPPRRLRTRRTA